MNKILQHDYQAKIHRGFEKMRRSKVAICATVRDCAPAIRRNRSFVETLRQHFSESHVIIIENDSKDETKSLLRAWASQTANTHVICEDLGIKTIPDKTLSSENPAYSQHRIANMAAYRNKYLAFIEEHPIHCDYIIVIDLDVYDISLEGIANTFGQAVEWHAVTSNGRCLNGMRLAALLTPSIYYDTFPLREIGDTQPQTMLKIKAYQYALRSLKIGMLMIPVVSAFNGMAIYDARAIHGLRYSYRNNHDDHVRAKCEHEALHEDMAAKGYGRIFINPSQIVRYESRRSFCLDIPRRISRLTIRWFKKTWSIRLFCG